MVKRTRNRRGKKRRNILTANILKATNELKKINNILTQKAKKLNLFKKSKTSKRRKHKHIGGG